MSALNLVLATILTNENLLELSCVRLKVIGLDLFIRIYLWFVLKQWFSSCRGIKCAYSVCELLDFALLKKNRIGMLSNSNTEVEWTQLKQVRNRMKAKTLTHIAAIRLQLGHDVRGRSCVYEAWITRVRPYSRGAARPHLMCTVTPSVTWSISNCCPL